MRTDRIWRIGAGAAVLAAATITIGASPSLAACHAFTVSATNPAEGGASTVTVTRDAAVADSSIRVTSVDGSAKAGSDYAAVDKTISFTGNETSEQFQVSTVNDAAVEPAESFTLKMSNPGGCAVNPNFDFDDTATVTISDNDQIAPAPTTTAKPIAIPPTTKPGQATTTTPPATTTSVGSTTTTDDTTTTTDATLELASDDDDSSPAAAIALGLGALAVAGAIGYLLYRRRLGAPPA